MNLIVLRSITNGGIFVRRLDACRIILSVEMMMGLICVLDAENNPFGCLCLLQKTLGRL